MLTAYLAKKLTFARAGPHWSTYKFLARYHYLHHKYPHKNFNVVFPLADYVLGTHIRASTSDLEDMSRLGLLP
jgi:sterol desaturase/sphingolipid hydroxylase (fatty acid hydroxylase superfamily)